MSTIGEGSLQVEEQEEESETLEPNEGIKE